MQLKLIDNFLSSIDFTNIRDLLLGSEFPGLDIKTMMILIMISISLGI